MMIITMILGKLDTRKLGSTGSFHGGSESEGLCDTGDEELLEAVKRTATASLDRKARDKRATRSSKDLTDSKLCKCMTL